MRPGRLVVTLLLLATPLAQAATPRSQSPRALEDADVERDPPALADAIAAYEAKKPQTASYQLHALLRDGDHPDREGKIQYFLARSLADLGMHRASRHYLLAVVKRGPSDPWFDLALSGLAAATARTGDDAELTRVATRLDPAEVPPSARDDMAWLRGLRAYEDGDLTAARNALAEVPEASPYHARARYLTAVILTRQDRPKSAATTFREVVTSGEDAAVRDLSILGLGRVHYAEGLYETADDWYAEVPRRSAYWPQSVFESAWANFSGQDAGRTLGQLLTLEAPSIAESDFLPEADVLAALTWYTLCDDAEVDEALTRFEGRYQPMHAELSTFLRTYGTEAGRSLAGEAWDRYFGARPAETVLPKGLFARALRDRELATVATELEALDAEEALVRAQKAAWRDTVGEELLTVLADDRERLKRRGGLALLRKMATTTAWLGDLLQQAEVIRFERTDRKRRELAEAATTGGLGPTQELQVAYAVSTDKVNWPFNGEFWDDELGSYRVAVTSSCR